MYERCSPLAAFNEARMMMGGGRRRTALPRRTKRVLDIGQHSLTEPLQRGLARLAHRGVAARYLEQILKLSPRSSAGVAP